MNDTISTLRRIALYGILVIIVVRTQADWQYEFTQQLVAAPAANRSAVYSISWGWSEQDQCTGEHTHTLFSRISALALHTRSIHRARILSTLSVLCIIDCLHFLLYEGISCVRVIIGMEEAPRHTQLFSHFLPRFVVLAVDPTGPCAGTGTSAAYVAATNQVSP